MNIVKIAALLIACLVCSAFGSAFAYWRGDRFTAREIEIVDDSGRAVLILSGDRKMGFVRLLDERGGDIASIGIDPYSGGGQLIIRNSRGEGVCEVSSDLLQMDGKIVLRDNRLGKYLEFRAAQ